MKKVKKTDEETQVSELEEAINNRIGEDGMLLMNWVVVAEYIASDGETYYWEETGAGTSSAMEKGLLHKALWEEWEEEDDE